MTRKLQRRDGFTATELVLSMLLLAITLSAALSGWLYIVRGERQNSVQAELDIDVRTAMEWVKSDLRLSAMDHVFYYPEGAGPYNAISFPVAELDPDTGTVALDENNKIIWTETVVYHVWETTPHQLRITTFNPRDNSLTHAQRQEQLNSVVEHGNGDYTYNNMNTKTHAIFENLFTWEIRALGAFYDAYSPTIERRDVPIGSALIDPGYHEYRFSVVGKNDNSAGYKIGLDTLTVSPCGVAREAEDQLPVQDENGANAYNEYREAGSWSANHQLLFEGSAEEDYFILSMQNDRWEETNFDHEGCTRSNTLVRFDQYLSPKDYVVRLAGGVNETNWMAIEQTGAIEIFGSEAACNKSTSEDLIKNCAIRVLIRGQQMAAGGHMMWSGGNVALRLDAGGYDGLDIEAVYIAEAADHVIPTFNAGGPATRLYFQSEDASKELGWWGADWVSPQENVKFPIERDKSYVVTLLIGDDGTAEQWYGSSTGIYHTAIVAATNSPDLALCQQADWSGVPYDLSKSLLVVKYMETTFSTNGVFLSQVVDTHVEDPEYTGFDWNAEIPSGTSLDVYVRAASEPELIGSASWQPTYAGLLGRYVQFGCAMTSKDEWWFYDCLTPKLRDVTITWTGPEQITDVSTVVTKGPDYGIFGVTVDGKALVGGLSIDLEIFETIPGLNGTTQLLTSAMTAEIEPRNTGK
jgi:type II secretory pathway pseudopilin PulG/uncharacterized Zn-binding protein involved in type VI secretion